MAITTRVLALFLVVVVCSLSADATCTDKMAGNLCQKWVSQHQCKTNEYVQQKCPKSCFNCGTPPPKPCQNTSHKCGSWKKYCRSIGNVRKMCPYSCGMCRSQAV
ncbi:uncharacterized protein ZK673.1-like [Clytia hemisphaerica]|uniref:ShKT domain-containing protein n=1 Tax=Clytia hemisphaerica TaxID=252671 RepID=A0A7M5XBX4_9CNID